MQFNPSFRLKNIHKILILLSSVILVLLIVIFYPKEQKSFIIKRYNPKTKATHTINCQIRGNDTILNGPSTVNNKKGVKIAEGNFVNDQTYGKWNYYSDNGKIEGTLFLSKNNLIAEGIWYYLSGKIKKYVLYDEFGEEVFRIKYDEKGNVLSYNGWPLLEIYQYKISNPERFKKKKIKININQFLKIGNVLKYQYLMPNLPFALRDFKIESVNSHDINIKRVTTKKPPAIINVEETLLKKGIHSITAIVKYEFNDIEKTVINDTLAFTVEVH